MRKMFRAGLTAGFLLAPLAACNSDRLTVPNYQNPTPGSIQGDVAAAVPLLATGILRNVRDNHAGWVSGVGILGRESYNYTPTEGRNTTGYLVDPDVQTSFGGGALWSGFYTTRRNIFNLLNLAEGAADESFSAANKSAVRGFAHTIDALQLHYVIAARHDIGAPVDIYEDATKLAPFVSRDSVYNYIIGELNQAATELGTAGGTFPFALHTGFAGFTTPATFRQFNRALAARVNAYRASLGVAGCGAARSAACYQLVLTNLTEAGAFFNPTPTTVAALNTGVNNVYSSAASDVANGISNQASTNVVAHFRTDSGVALQAGGARDARYGRKVITIASRGLGATSTVPHRATTFDYSNYLVRESPIPIIRNEELILLRAEARWFTGNKQGAIDDINTIRTVSGGLAPQPTATTITLVGTATTVRPPLTVASTDDQFLDELLYNRRESLLFEGHRWIDMRRFGRLSQLTLDLPTHKVVPQLVPQAECLQRQGQTSPELRGPGCQ